MRGAALLLVAALAAGCVDRGAGGPPSAAEAQTETEAAAEPQPSGPAADPHGDLACDEETRAAIDETIDAQLAAFADDDFETALGLASEQFRDAFDVDRFRATIEDDYPVVADAVGHTSDLCVRQGAAAQLLVTVEGRDGSEQELVYTMTREGDAWRVAGAEGTAEPDAPVV